MRLMGDTAELLATQTYPMTAEEFVTEHGTTELTLPNGATTLADVLDCLPNEEFETPAEARLAIYSALGEEAIGRKGYSDRDATCLGEDGHEPVSL